MKKITILGSTGSIGLSTLNVVRQNPESFRVTALTAGRNLELLLGQIDEFAPEVVAVLNEETARELGNRVTSRKRPEILFGPEGFIQTASLGEADTIVSAMTGAAGLMPTYAALKAKKHVALANKETMVLAGRLIMEEAKKQGVRVLPVDSEHSAVHQALQGHPREDLNRVILTASGGPFRNCSFSEMSRVTPEQALNHPKWKMGPRISIDSATMMNKGLEVIEARWLFGLEIGQIDILIHPQSIVHSMVEYRDGSVIAQMGIPDMRIPIAYALSFPRHRPNRLPPLKLECAGPLSFEKADLKKFPCLALALKAAETGGSMTTVLNAANEVAIEAFLEGKIGFLEISEVIERTMDAHSIFPIDAVEQVGEVDIWARETARKHVRKREG
jgi:1-deoxy-D-xylulose-5-phosphate reductoisomerase